MKVSPELAQADSQRGGAPVVLEHQGVDHGGASETDADVNDTWEQLVNKIPPGTRLNHLVHPKGNIDDYKPYIMQEGQHWNKRNINPELRLNDLETLKNEINKNRLWFRFTMVCCAGIILFSPFNSAMLLTGSLIGLIANLEWVLLGLALTSKEKVTTIQQDLLTPAEAVSNKAGEALEEALKAAKAAKAEDHEIAHEEAIRASQYYLNVIPITEEAQKRKDKAEHNTIWYIKYLCQLRRYKLLSYAGILTIGVQGFGTGTNASNVFLPTIKAIFILPHAVTVVSLGCAIFIAVLAGFPYFNSTMASLRARTLTRTEKEGLSLVANYQNRQMNVVNREGYQGHENIEDHEYIVAQLYYLIAEGKYESENIWSAFKSYLHDTKAKESAKPKTRPPLTSDDLKVSLLGSIERYSKIREPILVPQSIFEEYSESIQDGKDKKPWKNIGQHDNSIPHPYINNEAVKWFLYHLNKSNTSTQGYKVQLNLWDRLCVLPISIGLLIWAVLSMLPGVSHHHPAGLG